MITGLYCYNQYCIENPLVLLIAIPVLILLIFLIYRDFLKFRTKEEKKEFRKKKKLYRLVILFTRLLILFMIVVSLADPFTVEEVKSYGDPKIKLLVDSSRSMEVYNSELVENIKKRIESEYVVELSQISSGTTSELGEGILRNIEGNDNLVILTDGNNNFGKSLADVGIYARLSNSRLFAIDIEPEKNDAYVRIKGPSETIAGTPTRFNVNVEYVGAQPSFTLQIYIDGSLEFSGQNVYEKEVLKVFSEGYHEITAKIMLEDHFEQNNMYYKSVKSVPKPKIAFVSSKSSPLEQGLNSIYEFSKVSSLPKNLNSFSAVVLNDVPYSKLENGIDDLTGYLLDGSGLVFIGGTNSFDKGDYEGTLVESMLPVKIGTGKVIAPLKNNIVIVLDVSESFSDFSYKSGGDQTALDLGKGLAVQMIDDFRDDISVGLVAFATLGKIISEPVELLDNRDMLINELERLGSGEGTKIDQGLIMAEVALEQVKGTKNVILISDGKMGHDKEPHAPLLVAERMAEKGIKLYTVGLPSELYDVDINREYLAELAATTGGSYFEPTESQYLNVFFGKPEAKERVFSGSSNLAITDRDHFITQDLQLNARITGINFVLPKLGASSLIFTGDGNPVLNSWNFGLGRVVSLATDDGTEWAGELLSSENSLLLTRMINYAVGNPEKDRDLYISLSDGFIGEDNEIVVRSDKFPVSDVLTFKKEGDSLYSASYPADAPGYYQFFDAILAINPEREYYSLGWNEELNEMVDISGGKILKLDDMDIFEELKTYSERTELERKDLKFYPILAALIIFFAELIIRKVFEYKNIKV
jgi:hypothetical protein